MPFLAINATTIPVAHEPADAEVHRFGDEAEAADGTPLSRRRASKREWTLRTPWLSAGDAATVLAALDSAPPHAATGDLTGSIWVVVTVLREITHTVKSGRVYAYEFSVREE